MSCCMVVRPAVFLWLLAEHDEERCPRISRPTFISLRFSGFGKVFETYCRLDGGCQRQFADFPFSFVVACVRTPTGSRVHLVFAG